MIEINAGTDGELAFRVYHLAAGMPDDWSEVSPTVREAWEGAARAVHVAVLGRVANAVGGLARDVAAGKTCDCEACTRSRAANQPTAHH